MIGDVRKRAEGLVVMTVVVGYALGLATGPAAADSGDAPASLADFNDDGYHDLAVGIPLEDIGSLDDAGAVQVIYGTVDGLNGDSPIDDQFWQQDIGGVAGVAEEGDEFGRALTWGDFDGDGFHDLAIGVPGEDLSISSGKKLDAGVIHVLYGSDAGLTAARDVIISQNSPGVLDEIEPADRFGASLTSADFGNGSADDLAIGAPREDVDDPQQGAVNVLYGVAGTGLTSAGDQFWHLETPHIDGFAFGDEQFGFSLAAGDFGSSGEDDLAIGAPLATAGTGLEAGTVNVIYGSSSGLALAGNRQWHQDADGIDGVSEREDHFGFALAVGDFGGGPQADLAVGVPDEDLAGESNAGAVNVLYGSRYGLAPFGDEVWYLGTTGVPEDPASKDGFGRAVAAGDLGRSNQADLVVGAPGRDFGEQRMGGGAAAVIYGTLSGLSATDSALIDQYDDIEGTPEEDDNFGASLTVANFGKGTRADLAVGVPGESYEAPRHFPFGSKWRIGAVNVIYGSSIGLTESGDQFWWQRSDSLHDAGEDDDRFGTSLE
jgi:hypothetical protein